MLRETILCILCLLMISSACAAEEIPAQAYYCSIRMYPEIPAKNMKQMFSDYMVPGCEVYCEENETWCRSLLDGGDGGWLIPDAIIDDNERIRACREIAERLLHTAYPDDEPELVTAMPYRTFKECEIRTEGWELKDGQWYYFGRPLTQKLEAAITDAWLIAADRRERTEKLNPDWIILQYHPGKVCGLPTGIWLDDGKEYMDFCLSVFIFDAENHVVSAYLGGGFSAEPVRETTVTITEEEAIRLARDLVNGKNWVADWKNRGWETMDDPGVYDYLLQELGCSSIREKMVPEDSVRLVMAVNRKGQLQPAWECTEHYNLLMDDEVIQQSSGPFFFYLSAEDGSPLNP